MIRTSSFFDTYPVVFRSEENSGKFNSTRVLEFQTPERRLWSRELLLRGV